MTTPTRRPCAFCDIIAGKQSCHQIWEDEKHMAFLSIFPNTAGVTLVVPKIHLTSNVFALDEQRYTDLMAASRLVALHLDRFFDDVGRTGMIIEGFGINHAHVKLYPMHGTAMRRWVAILSEQLYYSDRYEGFLTSQDGPRADDDGLSKLAREIRSSIK
jgi:histidine triad (HIT) family protein